MQSNYARTGHRLCTTPVMIIWLNALKQRSEEISPTYWVGRSKSFESQYKEKQNVRNHAKASLAKLAAPLPKICPIGSG